MEENIDKNLKFQKLIIFYKNNKFKIYSIFGLLIISIFIILYLGINKKKKIYLFLKNILKQEFI